MSQTRHPREAPTPWKRNQILLPLCMTAALLGSMALGGVAAAENAGPAGHILGPTDPDITMPYRTPGAVAVCFMDLDGTGSYSAGDGVLLAFQGSCSGSSEGGDLALASWGSQEAGKRLRSSYRNIPLDSLSPEPNFWHYDADNTNRITPGDQVYLRIRNADRGTIEVNDVRLMEADGYQAGSKVGSGDADQTRGVSLLGSASDLVRHVDIHDTNTFSTSDYIYLTTVDTRNFAGAGDLRLYSPGAVLPFGQALRHGDADAKSSVTSIDRPVCFVDRDATGGYAPGDTLYLSRTNQCTGNVRSDDLRLNTGDDGDAGSRVASTDPDHSAAYSSLPNARVGYIDVDGNGILSPGDLVFLNVVAPGENSVRIGDILLTPTDRGPGAIIGQDDGLLGTSLQNLGDFRNSIVFKSFGTGTSPGRQDPVYYSPFTNTGQGLNPGDIRLTQVANHSFGGPVSLATSEVLPEIIRGSTSVCSFTSDPLIEDQVYLRMDGGCPSTLESGMIRLKSVGSQQAFSIVRSADSDAGASISTVTGTMEIKYYDVLGNSEWTAQDTLYLDIRNPNDNRISVGDIRLTSFGDLEGGRAVAAGDNDNNQPLISLGTVSQHAGYIDVDRNNEFDTHDYAYITPTSTQEYTSVVSVRLTPMPAPFEDPPTTEPPVETEDSTETTTESPDDETPTTPEESEDETISEEETDDVSTPAPAIGVVLAIIAIGVLWVRRNI